MTRGWADIDWDAPRPAWTDVERSHEQVGYEPFAVEGAAALALLDALRATHVNGGAMLAGFRIVDDDGAMRWFAGRNRFTEYDFFEHFLGSAAARETLPELQVPRPLGRGLGFEEVWPGTLTLDGELAATIVHGGAYEHFTGSPTEAKRLGLAFVDALDTRNAAVFLLCVTDTD